MLLETGQPLLYTSLAVFTMRVSQNVTSLSPLANMKPKVLSPLPGSSRVAYVALSSFNSALPAAVDENADKNNFIAKPFKPWRPGTHVCTPPRMAQLPHTRMLKLSLPGADPAAIPTLTAKQVARIPAKFLDFLQTLGRVDDYGDLTIMTVKDDRHNFTIISIAGWVVNGRLEHGELEVELLEPR